MGVYVLCPGPINTRIGEAERNRPDDKAAQTQTEAERRFYAGVGPLLSAGVDPAEVAGLVVRASPASARTGIASAAVAIPGR